VHKEEGRTLNIFIRDKYILLLYRVLLKFMTARVQLKKSLAVILKGLGAKTN
jgi:hypothetical protein